MSESITKDLNMQKVARDEERSNYPLYSIFSPKLELTGREHTQLRKIANTNGWSKSLTTEKILRSALVRIKVLDEGLESMEIEFK